VKELMRINKENAKDLKLRQHLKKSRAKKG
jgi:hypothetical protein